MFKVRQDSTGQKVQIQIKNSAASSNVPNLCELMLLLSADAKISFLELDTYSPHLDHSVVATEHAVEQAAQLLQHYRD